MELTRRELEVARLVGEGLTNRAIAERLFLSERTVEGHVEHALNKLGMDSRTQLAAWVAQAPAQPRREVDLPVPRTRFVGRAAEAARLAELVARQRLVTLVGTGGAGKTRLALEVARSQPRFSRVRLVDLAALAGPERVAAEVEAALPSSPDAATLLVVDNCEHVIDAAAEKIDRVLRETPVHVLATSREALRVEGETLLPVGPLAEADAVELFLDRAAAGSATAADAARMAARLDGLPLALELAAARTHVMEAGALARSLDSSLDVLTTGPRSAPPRQRRLDASIEWSYRLLSAVEQSAFRALGVFDGTFQLDAAAAVAGAPSGTVLALAERSLIAQAEDRFRLLLPVREFARRELAAGEREAAERRHDAWVVELARRGRAGLQANLNEAQRMVWDERESVWPALDRLETGDPDAFVTVALSYGYAAYQRVRAEEIDRLMLRAIRLAHPAHPDFALAQFGAAVGAGGVHDLGRQAVHARLLLDAAEAGGDPVMAGRALHMLGMIAGREGDHRAALRHFERAAATLGDSDPGMAATVENASAWTLWHLGDFARGEEHARLALAIAGPDSAGRAPILDTLAHNLLGLGRADEAEAAMREAAERLLGERREGGAVYTLAMLARIADARGQEERATTLVAAAQGAFDLLHPLDTDPVWEEERFLDLMRRHPAAAARGREMDAWAALEWALGGDEG